MSERLHPGGAAAVAHRERASSRAPASLPELAASLVERAEIHPSAAFVAADLARLGRAPGAPSGDRGDEAVVILIVLLFEALELGSSRVCIATASDRDALLDRARELGAPAPSVAALSRLLDALALALDPSPGTAERGRTPRSAPKPQLALSFEGAEGKNRSAAGSEKAVHLSPLLHSSDSPLGPEGRTVLVVKGGKLAFSRWAAAEQAIATRLRARNATIASAERVQATVSALAAPFGPKNVHLTSEQLRAVALGLVGPTTVITGGPGTGKTSIVVTMLRALIRLSGDAEDPTSRIALAAPTGKAADRLRESIAHALTASVDVRDRALAENVLPVTLHRLLGYQPEMDRYRFHGGSRLPARFVVVDEASMIDTMLFGRLIEALADDAVLVLLGDPDQLPSVGAGAILRDVVTLSKGSEAHVRSAHLAESHRMKASDPAGAHVLSVARRIVSGEVPGLTRELLVDGALHEATPDERPEGASILPSKDPRVLGAWLDGWGTALALDARLATATFPELGEASLDGRPTEVVLREAIASAHASRLLVLTRGPGPRTGLHAVNEYLGARHAVRHGFGVGPGPLPGEPVVVTANDYVRGIFNGDTGLVVEHVRGRMLALEQRGRVRLLPLDDVRPLVERAWALTVHRAQGSEHERVALLLPEIDVPRLLTREVVYTALTRARRAVMIVGEPALLARAVARRQTRVTGLGEL